jgi:hypothetical protein
VSIDGSQLAQPVQPNGLRELTGRPPGTVVVVVGAAGLEPAVLAIAGGLRDADVLDWW